MKFEGGKIVIDDQRTRYVVGFILTPTHVLLTQKTHPEWQRGKWNGIGGHVEPGESEAVAMQREYAEEVSGGRPVHWVNPLQMNGGTWTCGVFAAYVDDVFTIPPHNDVGEPLMWVATHYFPSFVDGVLINNLHWIIPLLRDHNTPGSELLGAVAAYR